MSPYRIPAHMPDRESTESGPLRTILWCVAVPWGTAFVINAWEIWFVWARVRGTR